MKNTASYRPFMIALFGAAACATPGAKPHDMSVGQHEAASQQEQAHANQQAAQYDPAIAQSEQQCAMMAGKAAQSHVCWSSLMNPTEAHRDQAQKHLKMAADHRAAAQKLRDTEAMACIGVSELDRDMSPFSHRGDIRAVEPLTAARKGAGARLAGARILFGNVPGLTEQSLRQMVDCHVARNAVLGHGAPEMASCPLSLAGIQTRVESTEGGLSVEVRSDDAKVATEILSRAQALVAR